MRAILIALALLVAVAAPALAAPSYANVTLMTYDPGHGTQVEYYDAAGNTFLWYPGNRGVVVGRWKTETTHGVDMVCFAYGGNTYNPVTGHRGGGWECMPHALQQKHVVDRKKGDVFGLASGAVPFVLTRAKTTIARLRKGPVPEEAPAALPSAAELCAEWLAGEHGNRSQKVRAALAYYHGIAMGKPCVKVDYIKAFTLLHEAGENDLQLTLLKDLRDKASTGNPRAVAALSGLERAGLID